MGPAVLKREIAKCGHGSKIKMRMATGNESVSFVP